MAKQTELEFNEAESPPLRVLAKLRNLWREQDRGKALCQETPRLGGERRIPSVLMDIRTTAVGDNPCRGDLKVQTSYSRLLGDCNLFNINTLVLREQDSNLQPCG